MLYTLVPWVGVMAAGYAFGTIMTRDLAQRRRLCLQIGISATVLFVVLAGAGLVVHPATTGAPPAIIRFLNQTKYPASPLFLLMTLGPTIALIAVAERVHGWIADVLATFGRVPMFYYLLHIPLIHATALSRLAHARWQRPMPSDSRLPRTSRYHRRIPDGAWRSSTWCLPSSSPSLPAVPAGTHI